MGRRGWRIREAADRRQKLIEGRKMKKENRENRNKAERKRITDRKIIEKRFRLSFEPFLIQYCFLDEEGNQGKYEDWCIDMIKRV